jgi:hypothetical protein
MPFKKGQSGNPQGRRVECLPEIKDLARQHTKNAGELDLTIKSGLAPGPAAKAESASPRLG